MPPPPIDSQHAVKSGRAEAKAHNFSTAETAADWMPIEPQAAMLEVQVNTKRGKTRPFRKLLFSLAIIILGIVLIEGFVRIRQWRRFGTTDHFLIASFFDPATRHLVPTPLQNTKRVQTDSRGFRSPELVMPKPAQTIRMAFLGASTSLCLEATNNQKTWPHLVWQACAEKFKNNNFDYLNSSMTGWGVGDSARDFDARVAACRPDITIIYQASNDFVRVSRDAARRQGIDVGNATDEPTGLASFSLAWYLVQKNLLIHNIEKPVQPSESFQLSDADITATFREELKALILNVRNSGSVPVVLTFSHRARGEQTPREQFEACQSSLFYMPWMTVDGIRRGFDLLNATIRDVAKETNCLLIDDENSIPGDAIHYTDSVHLTDEGCEAMARRVCDSLFDSREFKELLVKGLK
ncbi:MAG: SGNH/GDSL hydrolase family protein [Planctomycetota bacterium]